MAKNINFVSHKKSKVKSNGKPQLPSASALVEGEIAVNYAKDVETLSIKNESGTVVTFSSDDYYSEQKLGTGFTGANSGRTVTDVIEENEEVIASALNDLNGRKLDASAYTPTDLSNYYTKDETSGKTEISNALGGKVNTATFTGHTTDTSLHFSGNEKRNLDALATNIESISGITSNDISNWNAAAGVDMSKYYKKTETSGSTELSTAFSNKADSSALTTHTSDTTIHITSAERTAWNAKADISDIPSVNGYADSVKYNSTSHYVEFYHGTTAGTKVFEYDASPFLIDGMVQNVEIKDVQSGDPSVTVTCLVVSFNTDAGKQDINIPISQIFDANNYYTKSQTSGATELQTAFNGKTDTATTTALNNVVTAHTANTNIHLTTTEKGQLHTHTNKTYLDGITGTVGTMAYENKTSYSSATQVSTALADKVDKTEYATFSAATNTSINDLSGQSETIAAALNDLNNRKLDVSAYTPITSGDIQTQIDESLSSYTYDKSEIDDRTTMLTLDTNGYDYVDLGLPSGTLWATMNVGASSETDYGNYYQYGKGAAQYAATSGDSNYSGIEDPLDSSVDTAVQVWGGYWHMPTRAQMQELTANTTYQWVTDYKGSGINGGTLTATNGAVLFFPAAGYWYDGSQSNVGDYGFYWGSSPDGSGYAYNLGFGNGYEDVSNSSRGNGYSVRGVINGTVSPIKDVVSDIATSLDGKVGVDEYEADSMAIAAALNDLNTRKLDASAYTPTDLSNYYTKSDLTATTNYTTVTKANSANTASTVALTGVTGADDLKAIEALTSTSGILKKTAANTWSLDTTSYSSATQVSTALGGKADNSSFTAHTADTSIHLTSGNVQTQIDNRISGKYSIVSAVTVWTNLTNVSCPNSITGASNNGAQATVIYKNGSSTNNYTVSVSTSYETPDGNQLELTCPKNGYCEVNYLNINGTIYARGV